MSIQTRIKNLEKSLASDADGEVKIKVTVHDDEEEYEREYSIFQAKKRLGMLSPKKIRNTIWVGPETDEEDPYTDLTEVKAKAILKKYEEVAA